MKKFIVTGGAGFIGSHLTEKFLKDGCQVTVIDNFSTGRPENLSHVKDNPNLKVIEADVNDRRILTPQLFENADGVIHLAALADIVPSMERPLDYHHANVSGTAAILEVARAGGVKKFIYAASGSCYGIPTEYPTTENAKIDTQYPYAVTKFLGERYVMNWGDIYKMPVISLRFFNVYGPRSRTSGTYGAVFGTFLAQKLKNQPFTVVGDGTQSRDFTFVTDVVDAVNCAVRSDVKDEIFNVSSGKHYTVNRLVELLGGPVTYIPHRPGEPQKTFGDISKIKKHLGWSPTVSFEEGVAIMLKNINYWQNAPVWTPATIEKATEAWFKYLQ